MPNDNATPLAAKVYDKEINNTVPYYQEFYNQTLDVVEQYKSGTIKWLDLGCGTGTLEELASQRLSSIHFTLLDPSEEMLKQVKKKLNNDSIRFICSDSASIQFLDCFDVVTAIQSHHYMHEELRIKATQRVYNSLKLEGIYIYFENVIPDDNIIKMFELLRWGKYQQKHEKTEAEAKAHNARCGTSYYPLTVDQHRQLLKGVGFSKIHVFWHSYMQMGIYGIK